MRGLPPGPSGALRQSMAYAGDPYGHLGACARVHGDVFTLPLISGPVVVCGHPEGARQIFEAPPETFDVWCREQMVPVFGADSIFTLTGAAHGRHRRAVSRALRHRGALEAICAARCDALRPGEAIDVAAFALEVSLAVIVDAVFGAGDDAELTALLSRYVEAAGSDGLLVPLVYPAFRSALFPPWRSFLSLRGRLHERLGRLLRDRAGAPTGTRERARRGLDELIDAHGVEGAVSDLVTLLVAGHETTARAAAFAIDHLTHTPAVMSRLVDEIEALPVDADAARLAGARYLDAVIEETLRLDPVVVQVTRTLTRPFELMGHALPAGASVAACAALVHRRDDLYDEPGAFRPERFVGAAGETRGHGHGGAWGGFPFGGGPTRCPGAAFAKDELRVLLFHLLRRFRLEAVSSKPARAVVKGLVMAPDGGVRVRLTAAGGGHV